MTGVDRVVAPTPTGLLVADRAEPVAWDDVGGYVVAGEREGARWVWPDTASAYPRLLAAGVRVARCHDLRLARVILSRAVPDDSPEPAWLEPAPPPAAPTLLDEIDLPEGLELSAVVAEHRRQLAAVERSPAPHRLRLLLAAESAGALIAAEMHADGLPWDRDRHEAVLVERLGPRPAPDARPARMEQLTDQVRTLLHDPALNPDSQVALLKALRTGGLDVTTTAKWELARQSHPVVAPLLEYKALHRLLTANGWAWLDAWVEPGGPGRRGRFRTDYVPGGVVTGRWATSGGGALQIPRLLRGAVVADPGWRLVVADAAQIEPRCLAGMAGDEALAAAGQGRDLYTGLVDTGVVPTRDQAKVGMLSALYGGTAGQAGAVLHRLRRAHPVALGLVERAARTGEEGGTVRTWLGRTCPPPGPAWAQVQGAATQAEATPADEGRARAQARDRGRFTRNFVVQGTAAEWALCWMAETRRRLRALGPGPAGPHLVFFLHDELVVHTPEHLAPQAQQAVREAAEAAGRLLFGDFPLTFPLDVATVTAYDETG